MQDERVLILPSWQQRLQNENYKNWVKIGYGIDLVCKAIRPYVEREAKAFHATLKTTLHGLPLCACVHTPRRRPNPYHDMSNCSWARELERQHKKRKPTWSQSNSSLWNDHWEVAKLYMPYGCAKGNSCAETDATGLLNLLCWCNYYKTDTTLVEKFRDTRNAWGHAPKQEFDATETNDAFLSMKDFLQDAEFSSDPDVIDALNEVTKLESDTLIDFKDIEVQAINHLKDFIISIKDEIIEKVDRNAAHTTEIKDILHFCMKGDADRDNVLSDIQNRIETIELREQEKSKQNRWILNTLEKIFNSFFLLIVKLLIAYLTVGKIIPSRARVLFLFLVLSVTILEENTVDSDCERNKLYDIDPFELKQFDFTEYLNRAREGFVGRQSLFNTITESIEQKHKESRGVLIVGPPGFGKSALISNLICSKLSRLSLHSQILGYHFCIHSDKNTLNGAKFVRNLANMIASRLPNYKDLLYKEKFIQRILKVECLGDPTGCFEQGILAPLLKLQLRFEYPMYIVVDALDECLDEKEKNTTGRTIVDVLQHKIKQFPSWLKVITTTRNQSNIRRKLRNLDLIELHPDDPENLRDIERFLTSKLEGSIQSRVRSYVLSGEDMSVSDLVQKSQGNFLYIKLILEYLLKRGLTDKSHLPDSINSVYQDFFERKFDSLEKFSAPRTIFEILVATKSPVTVVELYDILSDEKKDFDFDYDLLPVLEDLSMYLLYTEERQSTVSIFHNSLTEWLTSDSNKGGVFYVNEKKGSRALANHFLKVINGNFSKVNPKFIFDLTTYIVVGGHLKRHTDSFLKIDPTLIKVKDKRTGFTALHLAAEAEDEKVLGMLLNIFKDANVEDIKGRTAAFIAVTFGRFNNLRLLHEKGASLSRVTKRLPVVKKSKIDDALECKRQMCGYSLLHVAAQKGHKDIVEYLINNGSDVSLLSATGNSAVQLAAEFGHIEIVELLLLHGAEVDNTCLYYAALYGQVEIVEFLLKKGVKDSCIRCDGIDDQISDFVRNCNTALHAAAIGDYPDVIETLLTSKHNAINCVNYFGKEPIHEAVHHNSYRAVNAFLKHGVDTSNRCKLKFCGYTQLHLAAHHGFAALTSLLLEHNADYNATNCEGLQPIHVASCQGHGDVVSVLVEHGADINSKGPNDMTPIHYACRCKATEIFDKLFELGANGLALTADGKTPLRFLVQEYLIDKKFYFVDPYAVNPIDPVTFVSSEDKAVKSHMREHFWLTSSTKFLQSLTKSRDITLSELGTLLGPLQSFLSYGSVLPENIIGKISIILLGSDLHINSRLVVLSTPATFPVDIGLASFLQNQLTNLNKLSTTNVFPPFVKKGFSTALTMTMTMTEKINFKCPMLAAFIHHNMVYAVDAFLQLGMDVNCEESGLSPLLAYLRQGGRNMAKVLAKHDVTVDIRCGEYFQDSVFHLAAYHKLHYLQYLSIFVDPIKWEEYLKEEHALFDYLFDVYDEVSTEGQLKLTRVRDGPVTVAIKSDFRNFKIIDDCFDNEGYTALQRAAQGGNVVAVKHFLDRGANDKKQSPEGFDILTLTIWYAVKYRPFPNFHETGLLSSLEIEFASLTASVILNHLTKKKPFDIGCDDNRITPTLLHLAATRGMWRFINDLFVARDHYKVTDLTANCPTKDNITPMYLAKLHGGDDCDWDNPWCKVVGVLLKYGASMIYPDEITEYLLIFNNLFQNLPGRLDLNDLDEKEIRMLRGDHKECSNLRFKDLATEMIASNLTKNFDRLLKMRQSQSLRLIDINFSHKALTHNSDLEVLGIDEAKFLETKLMYEQFLTTKLFTFKDIFMFVKNLGGILRCIKVSRFDANSKCHGKTGDTYTPQPERCKEDFLSGTENDANEIELDATVHIPDMCSSTTKVYFERLGKLLEKNRHSYNNRYETFIKKIKDVQYSSRQFYSDWDREYSLAVQKMFYRHEKKMFCQQKEITYQYARLKFLLHTLKFWSSQVRRNEMFPIISNFTFERIKRVFFENNKKQMINLILRLAKTDPLNEYEYMEMFRFSDPPLKEVFQN